MLQLAEPILRAMVAHCYDALPEEGCGLLVGDPQSGTVAICRPARNVAASARLYEVDPGDLFATDRAAAGMGLEIIGVFHSHTHTDAYPSPTDISQAPDPGWHYVVVSLKHGPAAVRSYRIVDGKVWEEPVVVLGG